MLKKAIQKKKKRVVNVTITLMKGTKNDTIKFHMEKM